MALFAREDHETVSWSLKEFTIGKDFKWSKPDKGDDRTELLVDRATHDFGIVYYDKHSIAAVEQFPDTEEPVYFEATAARAACKHDSCGKVTVLFEHLQLNLKFESTGASGSDDHISVMAHAHEFVNALEVLTGAAQNKMFRIHTVIAKGFDKNDDVDMVARGYTERFVENWMGQLTDSSHWPKMRNSGERSDFAIFAGTTPFPVHRVKICEESVHFRAVCTGGFAESDERVILLPESDRTMTALLNETYGAYNSTTGSLFTGFVLRSWIEKERVLNDLLGLFIAADKYNLEKVKTKVIKAIVDRLSFIRDPLTIVDLATHVFDDQTPQVDRGLRKAIIGQIYTRLPAILNDEASWLEYCKNKALLKAFHAYVVRLEMPAQLTAAAQGSQCASPPVTPTRANTPATTKASPPARHGNKFLLAWTPKAIMSHKPSLGESDCESCSCSLGFRSRLVDSPHRFDPTVSDQHVRQPEVQSRHGCSCLRFSARSIHSCYHGTTRRQSRRRTLILRQTALSPKHVP